MAKLTKAGEAIVMFSSRPTEMLTATGVARALSITTSQAQKIVEELVAEGKVESVEFGKYSVQKTRYRWVRDQ
jgi:DNA-binding IclR family transcriptional regulator